ncbi:MAG: hypothetical protein LH609_08335 [Rudanella sp.]|nr:hypothetical protein [Rudanella sp.]
MKNFTIACLLLVVFAGCKKEEEAEPEAGATVAATYQMTAWGLDNGTGYSEVALPVTTGATTGSGIVTAVRRDANTVELSSKITTNTSIISFPGVGQTSVPATLQKSSTGYDMLNNGTKIGTANGTTITIDITTPASGTTKAQRVVFRGKK